MNHWLAQATELVGERNPSHLVNTFVGSINQTMGVNHCLLLLPSSDGRQLNVHQSKVSQSSLVGISQTLCWSVVDFDVPFAHVLQSQQAMVLSAEDLVFWRANRSFSQLVEQVGMFDLVRVQPLPLEGQQVQSILMLLGNSEAVGRLFAENDFSKFLQVFVQQWSLLNEMAQTEQTRKQMRQSLSDIANSSEQHQRANQLSHTLIGDSQVMHKLRKQIISAANSHLSVMIQGETGTGKELVAAAIHQHSLRKNAPFIAVNCAAIPEHLLESELFGYKKGAFSGAESDKQGLIAQADEGTLFLDEIGDMPLLLQAKLLRVLESRTYRPLGGENELSSNFRLVSATHVNLQQQVNSKTFRHDLYYRLLQYPIHLPTLSERIEDIESLSAHFVQQYNEQHQTYVRGVHYRVLDGFKQYDFPGNVRELKNLIEFSCAQTADGTEIVEDCFERREHVLGINADRQAGIRKVDDKHVALNDASSLVVDDLKQALNDFEAKIIAERLMRFDGDRAKAAESLGIPKRTLAYKCLKLEIEA